ncbi:hypothetical protein Pelo_17094 [Pelomyxa schiedti]|nr:hypothetical protein Pelo_17094 [Pelomyxa schiedti]
MATLSGISDTGYYSPITRETAMSHAVAVSRVVWDSVVPWLAPELAPPRDEASGGGHHDPTMMSAKHAVALCRVGEALFPLRGLVCRALVRHSNKWHGALRAAAEAGSHSCVDWLITTRRRDRECDEQEEQASGGEREREGEGEGGVFTPQREAMATRRMRRRRENKEFMCVFGGLCVGGNLEMAKRLVGGGWPGIMWWGNDQELSDHVRASVTLCRVCERGWGDVAKWLVQTFGIREPWEFVRPLEGALEGGHLELAQWMVGTFGLAERVRRFPSLEFHSKACKSENLEVVKWCFETFAGVETSSCVDVCRYVIPHLVLDEPPGPLEFGYVRRLDVLKWMLSEFNTVPTVAIAENICEIGKGLDIIKFFVEGNFIRASPALFFAACKSFEDNTHLVKWLSTRVVLPNPDLDTAFVIALAHGQTSIASWLEDSHHILERHQGAAAAGQLLVRVCGGIPDFFESTVGLEWLLCRLDFKGIHHIEIGFVVECVEKLRKQRSSKGALLLLEKFPMIPEQERANLLTLALWQGICGSSVTEVKRIVSMMESNHGFSKDSVAKCLSDARSVESSKTVKLLITQFQLDRAHVTSGYNDLLFKLISWGQECCAEWLINKFHITFEEVLRMPWNPRRYLFGFDLGTWKMIVEAFPGITATIIKDHFLQLVCHSPVISQFTLRHFPESDPKVGPTPTGKGPTPRGIRRCWVFCARLLRFRLPSGPSCASWEEASPSVNACVATVPTSMVRLASARGSPRPSRHLAQSTFKPLKRISNRPEGCVVDVSRMCVRLSSIPLVFLFLSPIPLCHYEEDVR